VLRALEAADPSWVGGLLRFGMADTPEVMKWQIFFAGFFRCFELIHV
jgi:hypothetical protein